MYIYITIIKCFLHIFIVIHWWKKFLLIKKSNLKFTLYCYYYPWKDQNNYKSLIDFIINKYENININMNENM